jgi:hypothetical protein
LLRQSYVLQPLLNEQNEICFRRLIDEIVGEFHAREHPIGVSPF